VTLPLAAVAVLADLSGPAPEVLLGRRREKEGDPWSGNVALPGGRPAALDRDLLDTALRECGEESGIRIPREAVRGALEPVVAGRVTGRHVRVRPFLAVVDGFRPGAGDGEMEEWAPFRLSDLDRPELRRVHTAPDGSAQDAVETRLGTLWGMTLRLLERLWREPLLPGIERLWLDFDGTLYPASHPLAEAVDRRITQWLVRERSIPWEEADELRRDLYHRHGNTLRGMMGQGDTDPTRYLDFVFDLPDSVFPGPDAGLVRALREVAIPAEVFTNARADYVARGLRSLGVADRVEAIHDIGAFAWRTKPEPDLYDRLLAGSPVGARSIGFLEDRIGNLVPARDRGVRCILVDEDLSADWGREGELDWEAAPWEWKVRTASELPFLLRPHLGT
jgi:putative hydrolase of the HAD superfamily